MYRRFFKRACDIIIGLAALPFVGLTLVVLAPLIHREDKGPIFYNAPRVGRSGKEFTMYKLRSMKVGSPDLTMPDGSTYNGAYDPRMTRIGAFMRKASLDEMPQFINVLKGDMSVVGPRPDLKRETELYCGDEADKLLVKPGITGYAAVYGGRNACEWHDRLALDVFYVRHLTFLLDLRIFFKTFSTVFGQKGVFIEDEEGTEPRTGS
ncbi:MAG: sugar transferase [Coriobacteriaceae bacterium]|jgi:lipopolysaccharide/colanic/teichoic acid biosynthesis glycosyltransferase|nr:sugar transferase [Coriobacteriaceae bacterium]